MSVPLSGISTGSLLNGLGNNSLSSGFSSLATSSLAKFANSGTSQSQMFQQAAIGSPANAEFLSTLNQALSPAQGQVAGALQLVQSYNTRKQQEAILQQQQAQLLATQQSSLLGNLANPSAIGGGLLGQLTSLIGGQTATAPAAAGAATPVSAGGIGDISALLTGIIQSLTALASSGQIQ